MEIFRTSVWKIALALFVLGLLRSLILALVISPTYGPDGSWYLRYNFYLANPDHPDTVWDTHGTTPVYPMFAYVAYSLLGSGYGIAMAQIVLGALVAPAIFLALRQLEPRAAIVAGFLIAIDPQTGYLYQLVSTEALYVGLLGLGFAAFFWGALRKPPLAAIFGVGILLGLGAFARPVGALLIVPYVFFFALMTKSPKRSTLLAAGYITVYLALSLLNLWRFDFWGTHSASGFYLGTRLFSVGDLYSRDNGDTSEELYQLASTCDLDIEADTQRGIALVQEMRLCLYFEHDMDADEISVLYQNAYQEATQSSPLGFVQTMFQQFLDYMWISSDPDDVENAESRLIDCDAEPFTDGWWEGQRMFCPTSPTPLSGVRATGFLGILAFTVFTRVINFGLAASVFGRVPVNVRWLFLFCLGIYAYHAVVTAAAGTILSRYVTVTNPYTLVTLAFAAVAIWDWLKSSSNTQPVTLKSQPISEEDSP